MVHCNYLLGNRVCCGWTVKKRYQTEFGVIWSVSWNFIICSVPRFPSSSRLIFSSDEISSTSENLPNNDQKIRCTLQCDSKHIIINCDKTLSSNKRADGEGEGDSFEQIVCFSSWR